MKNQIIILCLAFLATFSLTNCNETSDQKINLNDISLLELKDQVVSPEKAESDYYYGIGSRFAAISKTDLRNATTIFPFNSDLENEGIEAVNSTEIIIIENDKQTDRREYGDSENLSDAQKALFKSLDYSSNFSMRTNFTEKATTELGLEDKKYNPHYTVVPETQAYYLQGETAILSYLIENSKAETTNLDNKKVRPAKVYYTITKAGILTNVRMDRTTGYPVLDKKLTKLISEIPGQWEPAKNAKGETVAQEFAFTFGPKGGC
jgi:hypothetical protein